MNDPQVEQVHFIGKDIVYFHTLFFPAMLHFSGRKSPAAINVHGFMTVSGENVEIPWHWAFASALPRTRAQP